MWAFLRETNARGTTIILTTHYLEEAESLCRRIAIIDGGRIIEHDTMSGVIRKLSQETFVLNFRAPVDAPPQLPGYASRMTDDHTIEVEVRKEQGLNGIFTQLGQQGVEVVSMRNKVNRLEELFMRLVERKDRAGADAG
jgi:ABC-2 type transport system ATP-binding protein